MAEDPIVYREYRVERVRPLYRGAQIVWYILYIIETLLLLRFVLRLFGANPDAAFTVFIYNISGFFVAPFEAVFGVTTFRGTVFEWTTVLAMIVYWILAWAIIQLFVMGKPVSESEAQRKLNQRDMLSH